MKFKNPLLVVTDLEKSISFYKQVLGLHVILDFGANVTLTGGVCLQTEESWLSLIQAEKDNVSFGGKDAELYFEEDHFDEFIQNLNEIESVFYIHPVVEHPWGQRVVRFFDPDWHIIEVGENMKIVCQRFFNSGMTAEEIAKRMDVPLKYVNRCLQGR